MQIIKAYSQDYDKLLVIWEKAVRSSHHFLKEEDILFYKPLVCRFLTEVELYIIRNKSGKIVAFTGLSEDSVEMLFVDPEEQRKNYGSSLFRFAVKEKHILKVDVNEQNELALRFYLREGFSVKNRDSVDSFGMPFPILHLEKAKPLSSRFSERFHMEDIKALLFEIKYNEHRKSELYNLIFDGNEYIAYQALWVCSHFSSSGNKWLQTKQNELIDALFICSHHGCRRMLLNLLYKQNFPNEPRVDFLNFCLEKMLSKQELPGVRSLCMKLAYELCRSVPELLQEYQTILECLENELLLPSIASVKRNVQKAMRKGKSLRKV